MHAPSQSDPASAGPEFPPRRRHTIDRFPGTQTSPGHLWRRTHPRTTGKAGVSQAKDHLTQTLVESAARAAYTRGRLEQAQASPEVWGYRFLTVGDDRVRDEHAALHGVVMPKDDPRWASIWPPLDWNCRCWVVEVYEPPEEEKAPPPGFSVRGAGLQ